MKPLEYAQLLARNPEWISSAHKVSPPQCAPESDSEEKGVFQVLTHELGNSLNIAQGFSEQIALSLEFVSQMIEALKIEGNQGVEVQECVAELAKAKARMRSVLGQHQHLEGILQGIRTRSDADKDDLRVSEWFNPAIF